MMTKHIFAFLAFTFIVLFIVSMDTEDGIEAKASDFNFYIHQRNGSDERATYADKQTVKDIVERGCFPIIPTDTNTNIQAICDQS